MGRIDRRSRCSRLSGGLWRVTGLSRPRGGAPRDGVAGALRAPRSRPVGLPGCDPGDRRRRRPRDDGIGVSFAGGNNRLRDSREHAAQRAQLRGPAGFGRRHRQGGSGGAAEPVGLQPTGLARSRLYLARGQGGSPASPERQLGLRASGGTDPGADGGHALVRDEQREASGLHRWRHVRDVPGLCARGPGHRELLSEPFDLLFPGCRGPPGLSDTGLGNAGDDARNRLPAGAVSGREVRETPGRVGDLVAHAVIAKRVTARRGRDANAPRVLLTFATLSWQKGSAAQVVSLVNELRKLRQDIRFALLSHWPELDAGLAQDLGIDVVGPTFSRRASRDRRSIEMLWRHLRCAGSAAARRIAGRSPLCRDDSVAQAYSEADLVIDLSGDSYRDPPGGVAFAHHGTFLAALSTGTPYALASQSIGPFRWPNGPFVRYLLNRAELVY